ncbi:hypothetical protein JW835_08225 [bacterium]|nr:hypothetical protein [bacterium]
MFTPETMEQIHVLFYQGDVEAVADTLVRHGALQLVDAADMETWAESLQKAGTGEESAELLERQERVESLFHQVGERVDFSSAKFSEMDWEQMDNQVRKVKLELDGLIQSQEEKGRELNHLRELKKHLEESPRIGVSIENKEAYTYLAVEAGRVADENMTILKKSLSPVLHVMSSVGSFGGMSTVILVGLRRDREKLLSAMREAGAQPVDTKEEAEALAPEAVQELSEKIHHAQIQFDDLIKKISTWKNDYFVFLSNALYQIKREALKEQIQKYFRRTEHTYLISGWIPLKERDGFIKEVRKATQNRCVIEKHTADELTSVRQGKVQVPVQMKNYKVFKPFELITGAYGIPAYRTIDPTPILGLSFMIMFGMMFGDVGHGLVLTLLGIGFLIRGKSEMQKHAGLLLCYVGGSSMVFGFLFGSLFGFEDLSWLQPLWMRPMDSISELFKFCIYFGIGMIFTSILINIVNAVRLKKYWDILFDNAGFFAALFYWSGIVIASRIVTSAAPTQNIFVIYAPAFMIFAMVLLFFREPIIHLAQGKRKLYPEGALTGIVSSIIELMEISLGFLANTVSFIRIAAFGLVHAGLAMAIFSLSDAVGGLGSVFVIIFGNVFIILLEGLVVSIQSVRLEFYEFFNRFFKEGRVSYRPLRSELMK